MTGKILEKKDLSITLKSDISNIYESNTGKRDIPMQKILENVEKDLILKGLHRTKWNKKIRKITGHLSQALIFQNQAIWDYAKRLGTGILN